MTRLKLLGLWLLCVALSPLMLTAQLFHALLGNETRAFYMAYAYDECGAVLIGGPIGSTVSSRTGRALVLGRHWAMVVAPVIDFFFGPGHCLAHARDTP